MVNFVSILGGAVAASSLISSVAAHPGEHHDHANIKRQVDILQMRATAAKRSLATCQGSLKHRDLMARSAARRSDVANNLRLKRGISVNPKKFRRDLATLQSFEAINHNQTGVISCGQAIDPSVIFSANTSCILAPEVTIGPYYVAGEYVRKDVKEDQAGVDLYFEVQYIDVSTCEPVPNLYIDVWNANATGVYSGVESGQAGLNSTFLRGIQETDEDGVIAFETIFPGHYEGRATHSHLVARSNVTVRENGTTASDGSVAHIGQVFFHEELRSAVEAIEPYNTNTQNITSNDDDTWAASQAENDYDPFPEFIYLGNDVSDGLLAWIQIGINSTADWTDNESIAATYQAGGGVASENSNFGGGGMGNGTMPSGGMPSGVAASGAAPTS